MDYSGLLNNAINRVESVKLCDSAVNYNAAHLLSATSLILAESIMALLLNFKPVACVITQMSDVVFSDCFGMLMFAW